MLKRLNELNFVIGLFFIIVSLILFGGSLFSKEQPGNLNNYTGGAFMIFGLLMVFIRGREEKHD